MRDHGAIVQPASDIAKLTVQWELAHGREQRAETSLAQARLDKGRLLVEARKSFSRSGPKARGWGELLEKWEIDERTARRYMELAGYVESRVDEVSDKVSEIPTYVEAGITKKQTQTAPAPPTDEQREASYQREVKASLPPSIETRQERTHEVVEGASEARVSLNRLREKNVHLTDVSTSPEDFMRAKQLFIDIANYCLEELANAGVLDGKEQRRQMTLLKGGIS